MVISAESSVPGAASRRLIDHGVLQGFHFGMGRLVDLIDLVLGEGGQVAEHLQAGSRTAREPPFLLEPSCQALAAPLE